MSKKPQPPSVGLHVLKFGGTSLGTSDRVWEVASIIAAQSEKGPTIAVVSALGHVTDELVAASELAKAGDQRYVAKLEELRQLHLQSVKDLTGPEDQSRVAESIDVILTRLEELLRGVSLVKECTPRTQDGVLSVGERLSTLLVAAALRKEGMAAEACDTTSLIVTDNNFGAASVKMAATRDRVVPHFAKADSLQIVTGFIAGTAAGETTTLGRGGSDYTATLLGAILGAEAVEIWTDVNGVMSADPRIVKEAFSLESLSYDELMELSHWGAKVMHPAAVQPAREKGLRILIRNTLNRDFAGTEVREDAPTKPGFPVRGIASINNVSLLRLEGTGLQGSTGTAERLFGALARERISVILITQASSERSICFAVEPGKLEQAVEAIHDAFALERQANLVDDLVVEERCSILAAVGDAMRDSPGIAGRIFDVLGHHRVNVRAIAQGSSELNISFVVTQDDEERALRAIHRALFRPPGRSLRLYVIGVGRVGSALLDQINAQIERLRGDGVEVVLAGLGRSSGAVLDPAGLDLSDWRSASEAELTTGAELVESAARSDHPCRVFVDVTASAEVVEDYESLLRAGVAVVSANKIAFSGAMERFETLRRLGARGRGIFFETTVGAGLPILKTIEDLVATGDVIERVEGVLSGTLGFISDRLMAGTSFSEALKEADDLGFTEPDPREDLGGRDVARKLVILGRMAGFSFELDDVKIEPLLPGEGWTDMTVDEFWKRLPEVDAHFAELREQAMAAGRALRYLASVDAGQASVRMTEVAPEHPCASLSNSENLVTIISTRYADTPLVVRGPGAGPDVTAAGVFADILRALAES
ncbi:MAG: bifunctional aspartate kinase/homoserine dehydrogenase I [Gemmatimonadetes bacterium]|nr:bifunctional aspartate kinase/homoserine dehydrogenase I [Gemmatimonadota bacterium]